MAKGVEGGQLCMCVYLSGRQFFLHCAAIKAKYVNKVVKKYDLKWEQELTFCAPFISSVTTKVPYFNPFIVWNSLMLYISSLYIE